MGTITAHDLNADPDFVDAIWFDSEKEVGEQLSEMTKSGWNLTAYGLISSGPEHGTVVARPLKIKGENRATGIGIFKIDIGD